MCWLTLHALRLSAMQHCFRLWSQRGRQRGEANTRTQTRGSCHDIKPSIALTQRYCTSLNPKNIHQGKEGSAMCTNKEKNSVIELQQVTSFASQWNEWCTAFFIIKRASIALLNMCYIRTLCTYMYTDTHCIIDHAENMYKHICTHSHTHSCTQSHTKGCMNTNIQGNTNARMQRTRTCQLVQMAQMWSLPRQEFENKCIFMHGSMVNVYNLW